MLVLVNVGGHCCNSASQGWKDLSVLFYRFQAPVHTLNLVSPPGASLSVKQVASACVHR